MIQSLLERQLTFTHGTIHLNLDGVDPVRALERPVAGASSPRWVLGHVLVTRNRMLELLGAPPATSPELVETFRRGSAPGPGGPGLTELLERLDGSQRVLLEALRAAGPELLEREVPGLFSPQPERAVDQLAALVFHEAYHAGQLGLLRRGLGLPPAIS